MLLKKRFSWLFIFTLMLFILSACRQPAEEDQTLENAATALDNLMPSSVTASITLPTTLAEFEGVSITWTTSNAEVLSAAGAYSRPLVAKEVTLTARLTYNDEVVERSYNFTIAPYSDEAIIDMAMDAFSFDITNALDDFTLPSTALHGVTVSWASDHQAISITNQTATVHRPTYTEDDVDVVLTATFSKGAETKTATFTVTVISNEVVSITFTNPTQLTYIQDESFVATGGKFNVTLDDDRVIEIPLTEAMITGFTTVNHGTVTVTATYLNESFDFDITVERKVNPVINQDLEVGDSLLEDFKDMYNPLLGFDFTEVPNSLITDDENLVIDERSLYFESLGQFKALFIHQGVEFKTNATYRFSFDYKLLELTDTIYFQINANGQTQYVQFGLASDIDQIKQFEAMFTIGSNPDVVIQIFPGNASGKTALIIDNFKIERIQSETNVMVDDVIPIGEFVLETFGDPSNRVFNIDTAQVPNSMITNDETLAINNFSMYVESNGNFAGLFLQNRFDWSQGGTYRITFDYELITFVDTIYFQLNGGSFGNKFTEFGAPDQVGESNTFSWVVTLDNTNNYLIQIFPGGTTGKTSFVMDNLKVERIIENTVHTGELDEGLSVMEFFSDPSNPVFNLDLTLTPESRIVPSDEGLFGQSLKIVSPGDFTGIYLNPVFNWKAEATYYIYFDYKILELADTIYFQLSSPSGNLYQQFGLPNEVNKIESFLWEVTLGDATDYIIQIFPGASNDQTRLLIDSIIITHKTEEADEPITEENVTVDGALEEGSYILETFGDFDNRAVNVDLSPVPNSSLISEDGIDGVSLYFESPGDFAGMFFIPIMDWVGGADYKITFDYKLLELGNTVYFQMTGGTENFFTQFGLSTEIGEVSQFTWTFTMPEETDYIIQMFPGGGSEATKIIIDNMKIERLAVEAPVIEENVTVDGSLEEGNYILETFGDPDNQAISIDLAPVPNSSLITEDAIEGTSLYFESPGSFTGMYFLPNMDWVAGASYKISFDYKLLELGDTIYFQMTGSGGNIYTQFGLSSEIGEVSQFTWTFTMPEETDYIIQMFPGGGSSVTKIILDNMKIERLVVEAPISEENVTVDGALEEGSYILETFGDPDNQAISIDLAPVPNSSLITEDGIEGTSLYFESPGDFAGMFFLPNMDWVAGASYQITFDYKLLELANTIYFQMTGGADNFFTQFGLSTEIGEVSRFTWVFTMPEETDYIIQMFPGVGSDTTKIIIDNMKIERLMVETNITVDGALEYGEYILETFGDPDNQAINIDLAPVPNSTLITENGIDGTSLYFESPGSFAGMFFLPNMDWVAGAPYIIMFDYILLELGDTIYFQMTGGSENFFTQFGLASEIGETSTFYWSFTMPGETDYIIQMFPGAGSNPTKIIIDNLRIIHAEPIS